MWWKIPATDQPRQERSEQPGVPDALIEEIESPYASGRTVVLVDVKSGANTDPMLKAFLESSQSSAVSGTVALLEGTRFESYRIGNNLYTSGFCRGGRRWVCGSCRCRGWSIWWCWRSALCLPSGYVAGCERKRGGAYW